MSFLGLDKFRNLWNIIKFNGGLRKSLIMQWRTDTLKDGKLVGIDKFGNKYYENDRYFFGKNRWVIYSDQFGYDYDASQIPPEWYGWIHYKTDLLPHEDPSRPKYEWIEDYTPNATGTPDEYVPYSTVNTKIQAWTPPQSKK